LAVLSSGQCHGVDEFIRGASRLASQYFSGSKEYGPETKIDLSRVAKNDGKLIEDSPGRFTAPLPAIPRR
jgi:hypothetical protein